ncbi:LPXTG cell wall anchor domain-containing protein [Streptomyces sp. NBC_00122]|uniref:LPXTG cell wall anchor domain-containing protein n=1 Tax=Streptomyces sp. NBC_00122 TaxID=2903623 RepID=UPI00324652F4
MRTALVLRTSIVTAALAGAMLLPAAGAAFAAPAAAPQAAAASDDSRYEGEVHAIGQGLVAVLRNKSEGPEAWIRAVSPDWKPGDDYMGKVLTVLNDEHRSGSVNGLKLELVEGGEIHVQTLVVTKDGKSTSYPLPKGQGSECVSKPVEQNIGAGALAQLMMTPNGPVAQLEFAEEGPDGHTSLTRANPSLPDGAGIIARILNASSAEPVFEWKTQGGGTPYGHATFPKLPKGCTFNYTFQKPTEKPQVDPKPSATPSSTPAAPKPQTAGQTSVVPKGGVAAGAEITTGDSDDSTTVLAGTGLAAILAGLGAFTLFRRRAQR